MDIARSRFPTSYEITNTNLEVTEIRFGIWGYCNRNQNGGQLACVSTGHGYDLVVGPKDTPDSNVFIGASWTRGLAIHPVATGVTFIAFLLGLSTHLTVTLIASLVGLLAALLTLLAFAVDIALYAFAKAKLNSLPSGADTITGPGFWLTFVAFLLLIIGSVTVCCGRRKRRMSDSTEYPMTTATTGTYGTSTKTGFLSRFRR